LPVAPLPRTATAFATARGKAAYATTSTRPDLARAVNILSQVRADDAAEADFLALEDALARFRNFDLCLLFPRLDLDSIKVHVYGDASFAGNADLTSQLGYVILLVDKFGSCAFIDWGSVKSRRVSAPSSGPNCTRAHMPTI
jgi:hypothetical protein